MAVTNSNYKGNIEIISGFTPKGGAGTFPLVEAKDVLAVGTARLDYILDGMSLSASKNIKSYVDGAVSSESTRVEGSIRSDLGNKSDSANASGSVYARIAANVANTSTNTSNIATNASNINTLTSRLGEAGNAANSGGNAFQRIAKNAADITALNATVAGLGGGFVATSTAKTASASASDKQKLWVYTGTTGTWTQNHWYYWNGSAWADGGAAGGITIDANPFDLNSPASGASGMAADSGLVSHALGSLSSDLDRKAAEAANGYKIVTYIPEPITGKNININGNQITYVNSTDWLATTSIPIDDQTQYIIVSTNYSNNVIGIFVDADGTLLIQRNDFNPSANTKISTIAPYKNGARFFIASIHKNYFTKLRARCYVPSNSYKSNNVVFNTSAVTKITQQSKMSITIDTDSKLIGFTASSHRFYEYGGYYSAYNLTDTFSFAGKANTTISFYEDFDLKKIVNAPPINGRFVLSVWLGSTGSIADFYAPDFVDVLLNNVYQESAVFANLTDRIYNNKIKPIENNTTALLKYPGHAFVYHCPPIYIDTNNKTITFKSGHYILDYGYIDLNSDKVVSISGYNNNTCLFKIARSSASAWDNNVVIVSGGDNLTNKDVYIMCVYFANNNVSIYNDRSPVFAQPGVMENIYINGKRLTFNSQSNYFDPIKLHGSRSYSSSVGCVNYQDIGSTELAHIILYGQSLSLGWECPECITTQTVPNAYMIGNMVTINHGNAQGITMESLYSRVTTVGHEHPLVACGHAFTKLYNRYKDKNQKFIFTSCGEGGRTIEQLSKNATSTTHYNDEFIDAINSGKALATNRNTTISCPAIIFMQGEWNYNSNNTGLTPNSNCDTTKDGYKGLLLRLKNDMQADIMAKYQQTSPPMFFIYQTAGAYISNVDMTITKAQQEFADENPDVQLLSSTYFTPDYSGGHLSTNGYRWYGEMVAKQMYQFFVKGENTNRLYVESVDVTASHIYLHYHVPYLPLVLDTYTKESIADFGYRVIANDNDVAIASVTINNNTVILRMSKLLYGEIKIIYAGAGRAGSGNLRDSDPYLSMYTYYDDRQTSPNKRENYTPKDKNGNYIYNKPYPMYNWADHFYYSTTLV